MSYLTRLLIFISCLFLFSAAVLAAKSQSCQTFDLTADMIKSYESCPVQATSQLNCSPYHQTTNYTCGPAAVMTLMRYYGMKGAGSMGRETEMHIASEMGAVSGAGGGTTKSQLADWLSSHGFNVSTGSNVTTDMLIDNIKRRIPTIISFNNHWVVAKGYRKGCSSTYKNQDEIIFADSCCNVSVLTREEIDSSWQMAHMQRKHCSVNGDYIIATPNR